MRRWLLTLSGLAVMGLVCWLLPPFRVVPLKQVEAARAQAGFDAAGFAGMFWNDRLPSALDAAPDATVVLDMLRQDPKMAANHGRTVGVSDTVHYLLRGKGTVVSVEGRGVGVSLSGAEGEADLLLRTGLLFGNTIRDANGLLLPGNFPNSQDFNEVSTQLNRIVEERVIPTLKNSAAIGRKLRFVVAAEVENETEPDRPLKVVPVRVEFD